MAKHYQFVCLDCGHIHKVSYQKYIYFLGSRCEQCGGPIIEKPSDA